MKNFERMIQLAGEVFDAHNDPAQLDVNQDVIAQLHQLHPATVFEFVDGDGPVIWVILIPTTSQLMKQFIDEKISETELLNNTILNQKYDSLYLCSAMTLQEFRGKGLTKKIILDAIKKIRDDHPIQNLFTWNFSQEGEMLAESIARHEKLPLLKRQRRN